VRLPRLLYGNCGEAPEAEVDEDGRRLPLIQKFDQHSAQELDDEKVAEWRSIIERQNASWRIGGTPPG
jgi:hypothetical protein